VSKDSETFSVDATKESYRTAGLNRIYALLRTWGR
jgi:hypothetical protein